ncbi:MAG: TIGR03067 domain-containing protein [Gemmataceae bacterium]|nr:TIGR03067 domain-containing protein [Gemmataceae bacterium]
MRWACVAAGLAVAVAVAVADDKPAEKPNKDLEPFQGIWQVVSIEQDGMPVPEEATERLTLVVKGNERVLKQGGEVASKGTFKVDAGKKPKTIDIEVSDGPLAGRTILGIYEVKDDTLKVCLAITDDGKRPDDFTAKEGTGRQLQVFKKEKAKGKGAPAKPGR